MRKIAFVLSILVLASVPVTSVQAQFGGQIGIYADSTRTSYCVSGEPFYEVEMWVYCQPAAQGVHSAEFAILYPSNVIQGPWIPNPDILGVTIGNPAAGISYGYGQCEYDWHWLMRQTLVVRNSQQSWVQVGPNPTDPQYHTDPMICTCEIGFPIKPVERVANLCINFCTPDLYSPFIWSIAKVDAQHINVAFAEKVTPESAGELSNYTVYDKSTASEMVAVVSAVPAPDGITVALTLGGEIIAGRPYLLEARNIYDLEGVAGTSKKGFGDLPDLQLTSRPTVPYVKVGCHPPLNVSFTMKNAGAGVSGPFDVAVEWAVLTDSLALQNRWMLGTSSYPGLAPGETRTEHFTYEWPDTSIIINLVQVTLDPQDLMPETNEVNNRESASYTFDYAATHLSVKDVPGDAGGKIRFEFETVPYRPFENPYDSYEIERRDPSGWTPLVTIPDDGRHKYSVELPTLADSSESGINWSVYRVHTLLKPNAFPVPPVYSFYPCPDSGYSVNNLAPVATLLESFSAQRKDAGIEIAWTLSALDEGVRFLVYRASASDGDFTLIPSANIVQSATTFTFVDEEITGGESYRYRVAYTLSGKERVLFETQPVKTPELPLTLYQNFPNPFNPATTIKYYLPDQASVRLAVYDAAGRLVVTLVNATQEKGSHSAEWRGVNASGSEVRSGVYFCRLTAGHATVTHKMILLR